MCSGGGKQSEQYAGLKQHNMVLNEIKTDNNSCGYAKVD